ncbi:signal peptidase I [Rariglobus hedericola]|uniref:Signal peptidase I n=1 Tax=Rariglobus hedericola TaxID=2597822 RepID=A0A556QNV3_9BACT|nr:signal peptidase I [Rariglobus hedericola]TSJ78272.1 signal peptidase I [Rariglobus hedericola]
MFFGLFDSVEKKMRNNAANWLELSDKVYNYRRDVLTEAERNTLQQAAGTVRRQLNEKSDASKLKLAIEALENALRRTGGTHYPKSGLMENVEFFLVAAIVILGVRMYFVQPFKIPTNSMWPSYNGMTPEVFASKADEPSAAGRVVRLVAMGARPRTLDAPASGEVLIPIAGRQSRGIVKYREVPGRAWFVFPSRDREYSLLVGDRVVTTQVPLDFDFDWVIRDAFFPGNQSLSESLEAVVARGDFVDKDVTTASGTERMRFIRTGKTVRAGERVLSFDILTGDQLFVDRVSYHFIKPQPGDGFVFRTDNIDSPYMKDAAGRQLEQYYIKRLAGTPGDKLEIREPVLYRNGAPITGSTAFNRNATHEEKYPGYRSVGLLAPGQTFTVPPDSYVALGDNSANSQDSRYWGTVPAKDVVGRPLFIYYPFTKRWGVAP